MKTLKSLKNFLKKLFSRVYSPVRLKSFWFYSKIKKFSFWQKLGFLAFLCLLFSVLNFLVNLFSYQKVDFYLKNLRTEKAFQELKKKEKFFENSPKFKIRLAHVYLYQGKLRDAYQNLKSAYQDKKKEQSDSQELKKIAILLANRVRTSKKEKVANQVLEYFCFEEKECQKYLSESYLSFARKHINENRLDQAEEFLLQLQKLIHSETKLSQINLLKKDLANAYSRRSKELNRLSKYQEAEESIKKALAFQKDPFDLVIWADLIYRKSKQSVELEKAVSYYKEAYFNSNKDPIIFTKHQKALEKLEKLLKKEKFAQSNIRQILARLSIEK